MIEITILEMCGDGQARATRRGDARPIFIGQSDRFETLLPDQGDKERATIRETLVHAIKGLTGDASHNGPFILVVPQVVNEKQVRTGLNTFASAGVPLAAAVGRAAIADKVARDFDGGTGSGEH